MAIQLPQALKPKKFAGASGLVGKDGLGDLLNSILAFLRGPANPDGDVDGNMEDGFTLVSKNEPEGPLILDLEAKIPVAHMPGVVVEAEGLTPDATPLVVGSVTIGDNTAVLVTATILAREKAAGANRATYIRRALYFRQGGIATIQGAVAAVLTEESDAVWDATLVISTNDVQVSVTGKAATDIDWNVLIECRTIK